MDFKNIFQAIVKFLFGFLIVSLMLFISAGSINYWNGWLFIVLLFCPMFMAGIILMIKKPELLKKRLNAKEKENEQNKLYYLVV